MDLFVDNTGFHAVGRCLDGEGLGEVDVRGLLQFATELIFSDRISVSAFEIESIVERTRVIRRRLVRLGIGARALSVRSFHPVRYAKACRDAAQRFVEEMDLTFSPDGRESLPVLQAAKPDLAPADSELFLFVHRAITGACTDRELEWAGNPHHLGHAAHSVAYMLAWNPSLLDKIRAMVGSHRWSFEDTQRLVAVLRYYVNEDLAKRKHAFYAPAVARATMVRRATRLLGATLSKAIDTTTGSLLPQSLGVPSVAVALLVRARGDPQGVIQEAAVLREQATDLRTFLRSKLTDRDLGTLGWFEKARHQAMDLSKALRQEMNPHLRPHWSDAIDLHAGPPFFTVKLGMIRKWWEFRRTRKYLTVLTEMSRILTRDLHAEPAFRKLSRRTGAG